MLSRAEISGRILNHWNESNRFGVRRLWLFGSYAKGEQKEGSDIDILVEYLKPSFWGYVKFCLVKFERAIANHISACCPTRKGKDEAI